MFDTCKFSSTCNDHKEAPGNIIPLGNSQVDNLKCMYDDMVAISYSCTCVHLRMRVRVCNGGLAVCLTAWLSD